MIAESTQSHFTPRRCRRFRIRRSFNPLPTEARPRPSRCGCATADPMLCVFRLELAGGCAIPEAVWRAADREFCNAEE
jgi:hypothetical protein